MHFHLFLFAKIFTFLQFFYFNFNEDSVTALCNARKANILQKYALKILIENAPHLASDSSLDEFTCQITKTAVYRIWSHCDKNLKNTIFNLQFN